MVNHFHQFGVSLPHTPFAVLLSSLFSSCVRHPNRTYWGWWCWSSESRENYTTHQESQPACFSETLFLANSTAGKPMNCRRLKSYCFVVEPTREEGKNLHQSIMGVCWSALSVTLHVHSRALLGWEEQLNGGRETFLFAAKVLPTGRPTWEGISIP